MKLDTEFGLKTWAKGVIKEFNDDLVHVHFEHDNRMCARWFWLYSAELERYDTKS